MNIIIKQKGVQILQPDIFIQDFQDKVTKSNTFITHFFVKEPDNLFVHNFFLPELLTILLKMNYKQEYNYLLNNSWLSNNSINIVNKSRITKYLNITLKPYQEGFLDIYSNRVTKYKFKGYILSFQQGLGKTITSLALMESRSKDVIVIICPKSIIKSVWEDEINKIYKHPQRIWYPGKPLNSNYRFYIVNYESVDKLPDLLPNTNIGFIIDESHNLRNVTGSWFKSIYNYVSKFNRRDVLGMSGTPIKAMGKEIIPLLYLIDPFFAGHIVERFVKVYKYNTTIGKELLQNRMGMILHRKLKEDVLSLPKKTRHDIFITIPNGEKYELDNVKKIVLDFIVDRKKYYEDKYKTYESMFNDCLIYFEKLNIDKDNFDRYKNIVKHLKQKDYGWEPRWSERVYNNIKWANQYEKGVIYPNLSDQLKHRFKKSKAVIKYVDLKIEGEYLGGLLNKLRAEMYSEMIKNSDINKIVSAAEKKTICFSIFKEVLDVAEDYFKHNNFDPLVVSGDDDAKKLIDEFKNSAAINPLLASIKKLSTGVTIIEANTIIFLSPPWREADLEQAEDRVHRIGQDTDVNIYNLILKTEYPNLSTRTQDIITWSGEMVRIALSE